jgi:hypothetical protein
VVAVRLTQDTLGAVVQQLSRAAAKIGDVIAMLDAGSDWSLSLA